MLFLEGRGLIPHYRLFPFFSPVTFYHPVYLFSLSHALTALLISSVTLRLSMLAMTGSACVLFIFGMVLRKAPAWGAGAPEEEASRGQENG